MPAEDSDRSVFNSERWRASCALFLLTHRFRSRRKATSRTIRIVAHGFQGCSCPTVGFRGDSETPNNEDWSAMLAQVAMAACLTACFILFRLTTWIGRFFARIERPVPISFQLGSTSLDPSGKTLAEWHHRNEFVRPARDASAAGFFVSMSGIGRRPAHRGLALVETRSWSADRRAAVRNTLLAVHARTCRPAARALLAPPRSPETGISFLSGTRFSASDRQIPWRGSRRSPPISSFPSTSPNAALRMLQGSSSGEDARRRNQGHRRRNAGRAA